MFKTMTATAALVCAGLVGTAANAATWEYSSGDTSRNGVYGASFSFNDVTSDYGMSFEVDNNSGVDGYWVVISEGVQPLRADSNHAILYSDLTNVWAYQYDGWQGGSNPSYTGTLLEKFSNVVTETVGTTNTTYETNINVAALNALGVTADWVGTAFQETIGTWLHPTTSSFEACDNGGAPTETNGNLDCFQSANWIGWDESNKDTSLAPVPLPAGFGFLAASMLGFGALKRKKR